MKKNFIQFMAAVFTFVLLSSISVYAGTHVASGKERGNPSYQGAGRNYNGSVGNYVAGSYYNNGLKANTSVTNTSGGNKYFYIETRQYLNNELTLSIIV